MEYTVKEKIGLPVWESRPSGDVVVDTQFFVPGDNITTADFERARQNEDEIAMLVHFNCTAEGDDE